MNVIEKKMRNLPLAVVVFYISVTFILSVIGPMKYIGYEYWKSALFIAFVLIAFGAGYCIAHKRKIVWRKTAISYVDKSGSVIKHREKSIQKFVKIAILIALFVCILEFIHLYISNPSLLNIKNIGSNYANSRKDLETSGYSVATLLRFLTGFFRNISIVLGFYYLRRFNITFKCIWSCFIFLLLFNNIVGYGTQKILGDIIIYAVVIAGIKMLDMSAKSRRRIVLLCIIGVIATIIVFTIMQAGRASSIGLTAENFSSRSDGLAYYDTNNIIFKILGPELGFGFSAIISSYLSSGYYGLSLCLQLPFIWCYGVGSSYALSVFFSRFLGWENMYYQTYLYRMEEAFGRNGLRSWNTIFPWLASDLTFPGVIILFLFVGYIWSVAWDEILKYRNPISIVLFANISLGLVFIPANNQLFSGIDACMTTPFVIILWIVCHKRFNRKIAEI